MATTTTHGVKKFALREAGWGTGFNTNADKLEEALASIETLQNVSNITQLIAVVNSTVSRVLYNYTTNTYPARPAGVTAGRVEYVGPIAPSDSLNGDTWVDNS